MPLNRNETDGTSELLLTVFVTFVLFATHAQVRDVTIVARRSTLEAKMKEAVEDKEGIGTEGTAVPGEVFSAEREWVSEDFREADAELKGSCNWLFST